MSEETSHDILNPERLFSGVQKCAVLLLLIGEEEASMILKQLPPKEVHSITSAMFAVAGVDQQSVNSILDEFIQFIKHETSLGFSSEDYIKKILVGALGEDRALSVLLHVNSSSTMRGIELLEWMDARSIAEMVAEEHSQVIALLLSYLEYSVASDVLSLLPTHLQPEVIERIATLDTVTPEAVKELEGVMQTQFNNNAMLRSSVVGGAKTAAKIMNFTKEDMEQNILATIGKKNKELVIDIQDNMFIFENLIMIDEKSLQTLLRSIDSELLVTALKGADFALKEKIFSCMSTRASVNVMDELESRGPVRVVDVQSSQKQIISIARRMSDAGQIILAGRGEDFV